MLSSSGDPLRATASLQRAAKQRRQEIQLNTSDVMRLGRSGRSSKSLRLVGSRPGTWAGGRKHWGALQMILLVSVQPRASAEARAQTEEGKLTVH